MKMIRVIKASNEWDWLKRYYKNDYSFEEAMNRYRSPLDYVKDMIKKGWFFNNHLIESFVHDTGIQFYKKDIKTLELILKTFASAKTKDEKYWAYSFFEFTGGHPIPKYFPYYEELKQIRDEYVQEQNSKVDRNTSTDDIDLGKTYYFEYYNSDFGEWEDMELTIMEEDGKYQWIEGDGAEESDFIFNSPKEAISDYKKFVKELGNKVKGL